MPHIHRAYDFVVSAFIVHDGRVLLIHHRRYHRWLPIGGHIELDEDPEQALFREIREECGLKVRILANKPQIAHDGVKPVLTPSYVDVHGITKSHKHIAFVYFALALGGKVRLHRKEHTEFKWFSAKELTNPLYGISPSIHFYALEAIKKGKLRKKFNAGQALPHRSKMKLK